MRFPCSFLTKKGPSQHRKATGFCTDVSLTASAQATSCETQGEEKIRFKYNPATNRWQRVAADRVDADKYSIEKWEEGGVGVIQTKSGGSYTVSIASAHLHLAYAFKVLASRGILDSFCCLPSGLSPSPFSTASPS